MFRLKSIHFHQNKVFKTFAINFQDIYDREIKSDRPYFSLVIGPNGTGKSLLLKYIVEIFRIGYAKSNDLKYSGDITGLYNLEYEIDNVRYTISNFYAPIRSDLQEIGVIPDGNGVRLYREGEESSAPDQIKFPAALIANSLMITDKFPVLKEGSFPIYTYLGIRRTASVAGTRSYVRKTIELLTESIDDITFRNCLIDLLDFLDLKHSLYVSYVPKYKHIFFTGRLTAELIKDFFENFTTHTRRDEDRKPWGYDYFQKIKDDLQVVKSIVDFCNEKSSKLEKMSNSKTVYFGYDVLSVQTLKEDYEMIKHLTRLDLISFPSISLKRQNSEYELEESSSGEYHFFSTIVGLLAVIKNNSLLLIDEPEISLHPNWQMKYMEFLNTIFIKFYSSHFVITTHSHFLVSDLKPDNSMIIALSREKEGIIPQHMPKDTFGWSAEEVLLKVFKVATSRNYFVAEKLGLMLDFISKDDSNTDSIREKFYQLGLGEIRGLSEEDPLKTVYDTIVKEYVSERS